MKASTLIRLYLLIWLLLLSCFLFIPRTTTDTKSRRLSILIEITTVGRTQLLFLEELLDGLTDLQMIADVHLHIMTTDCDYEDESNRCHEEYMETLEQSSIHNYSPVVLSRWNEKLRTLSSVNVHVKSPKWGVHMVDHHRALFYQHIHNHDLFIHIEEDELLRPTHIVAYWEEMKRLEKVVNVADYNVGFIRYENNNAASDRVIWEFDDWPEPRLESPLKGYFTTPGMHHQGMYMATPKQLRAWSWRCGFHYVSPAEDERGFHRERIGGGMDLYDAEVCNVKQVIPIDAVEDFMIHHLPDLNHYRRGDDTESVLTTMDLHIRRMEETGARRPIKHPIRIIVDETDEKMKFDYDLSEYKLLQENGGIWKKGMKLPIIVEDSSDEGY